MEIRHTSARSSLMSITTNARFVVFDRSYYFHLLYGNYLILFCSDCKWLVFITTYLHSLLAYESWHTPPDVKYIIFQRDAIRDFRNARKMGGTEFSLQFLEDLEKRIEVGFY